MRKYLDLEFTENLKVVVALCLSNVMTYLYIFTDQTAMAHVSTEYLATMSILSYLSLPSTILGVAFGASVLTLTIIDKNKETDEIFSSAFYSLFFLSIFVLGGMIALTPLFIDKVNLRSLPGSREAAWILTGLGFVVGLVQIAKFYMVSLGERKTLIKWDCSGIAVNIIADIAVLNLFKDPKSQFLGICTVTLSVMTLFLVRVVSHFKSSLIFKIQNCFDFLKRARTIILNEVVMGFAFILNAFLISFALARMADTETLAAYNLGYQLMDFFAVPSANIIFFGVQWLGKTLDEKNRGGWDQKLNNLFRMVFILGICPTLIMLSVSSFVTKYVFHLESPISTFAVCFLLGTCIVNALVTPVIVQIRLFEKNNLLTFALLAPFYFISLPLFFFFARSGKLTEALFCGTLLPSLLTAIFLYYQKGGVIALRRFEKRHQVRFKEIKGVVTSIDLQAVTLPTLLQDLSHKGCSLVFNLNALSSFKKGAHVKGHFSMSDKQNLRFEAQVRHISKKRKWYRFKSEQVFVGLNFDNVSSILEKEISDTIGIVEKINNKAA